MANSKAISIRVPDELLEKIDLLAEDKYKSHKGTPNRSLVLLDAIVAYFDTLSDIDKTVLVSDSIDIREFRELQKLVNTLSDDVGRLKKEINTLSDITKRADIAKSPSNQLGSQSILDDRIY